MNAKKNNNTFRFPFDIDSRIFLGLAIVLFIFSISTFTERIFPKSSVQSIKDKIEIDVNAKITDFNKLIQIDTLIDKLFINQQLNNKELKTIYNTPYYLFLFENDILKFWNTNLISVNHDTFTNQKPTIYYDKKGYYIAYKTKIKRNDKLISAIAIIPVKNENPYNSDNYKKNYIVGDSENDYGIKLSLTPIQDALLLSIKGEPLYYIYKNNDFLNINDKNGWRLFFNALPFIFFGISIHTYFKVSIKRKKPIIIFSILILTTITIRLLNYTHGFPTDFTQYTLFDSTYFATDIINRSLGDTFINMCLTFWILLFYLVNVQGKIIDLSKRNFKLKPLIGIFVLTIMLILGIYLANLTYELIHDSTIDFDTTIFNRLDLFSFIGLLSFMTIFTNIIVAAIITNNYLNNCLQLKWHKYILLVLMYILFHLFYTPDYEICYYFIFICLAGVLYILDRPTFKLKFDFNSYSLLLWIILVSFFGAFFLTKFIDEKEIDYRKEYAEKLMQIGDQQTEDKISILSENISSDSIIQKSFSAENLTQIDQIKSYITTKYIWNNFIKYKTSIYIYDIHNNNLNQLDTLQYSNILHSARIDLYEDLSDSLSTFQIYLLNNDFEKGYFANIKIIDNHKTVGYLVVKLHKEILNQKEDYSDFIYQDKIINRAKDYKYSTAIYQDSILQVKSGFNIFPDRIYPKFDNDSTPFHLTNNEDISELWYNDEYSNKYILVFKKSNNLYLFTTLFAYIFLIYFIVITLYILGNIIARSNLIYSRFINLLSINLRLRIHFAILLVVFISFVAVGYFTSVYLINRVKEKSITEISNLSQNIQHDIETLLQDVNITTSTDLDSNLKYLSNVNILKTIAERYRININIFSFRNFDLVFSSENSIYNSGLLSTKINPLAKYAMQYDNREHHISQEFMGDVNFLASYTYIRNSKNENIALMQLPYISSNKEIKNETTNILTTLVNIYVFVFLLSSVLALFITNSVTRPFNYIVKQFTKINLSKTNQPLKWKYSDEIGLLVKEYNRMLRKLENSTILLAKSEREMAWREMAKQVAHEIKNPLTPMKLSLQMLERAIKNNNSNIPEITSRVTNTLIEQIDNLTLIATNFSNFAKMPELKREYFILNDILYTVTGMYNDDNDFEYLFLIPEYSITLNADKSQLIRVFTNIIQNANQSIPLGRKGNISLVVSKIKNNYIRVTISDNGEGISKEKGEKLFQPYFTTKTSGTGLGLAMCKDIVEQSGGKIWFESKVNEGTAFHIDLPIINEDELEEVDDE